MTTKRAVLEYTYSDGDKTMLNDRPRYKVYIVKLTSDAAQKTVASWCKDNGVTRVACGYYGRAYYEAVHPKKGRCYNMRRLQLFLYDHAALMLLKLTHPEVIESVVEHPCGLQDLSATVDDADVFTGIFSRLRAA